MTDFTDLVKLDDIKAPVLYGSDEEVRSVLDRVTNSALSVVFDATTAKGRKEGASLAAKVASSKTYLDGLGRDYVSELKSKITPIDARRKLIRDTLDALKTEVRRPVTEFEEAQKARVRAHVDALEEIKDAINRIPILSDINVINDLAGSLNPTLVRDFEEFTDRAAELISGLGTVVGARVSEIEKAEAQDAEIERLRKEAVQTAKRERDERISRESEQRAKDEAKQQLEDERERRIAAEKASLEAEKQAFEDKKQAEADRLDAEQRAKQTAIDTENQKKAAAEQAAADERRKIAEQAEQEAEEARAREADKKHHAKINNEAVACLVAAGVSKVASKLAIVAIAKNRVSHVKINY